MNTFNEDIDYPDNLSPELLKIKAELDHTLETKLDNIDSQKSWTWVQKQKAFAEARQEYDNAWSEVLTDAGIVAHPVFESFSRDDLITRMILAGKNYNFSKYSTEQLYRMWQRIQNEPAVKSAKVMHQPKHELDLDFDDAKTLDYEQCEICGTRLNLMNQCPVCDLGEEDY